MASSKSGFDPYSTVLVIVVGFSVLGMYLGKEWLQVLAISIGIAALLSKKLALLITRGWELLAKGLSYIVPNILLSAIFYLLLTPIAWLARIRPGEDQLILKNTRRSTFKDRSLQYDKASFEKPW
jgi:hypothetical protein